MSVSFDNIENERIEILDDNGNSVVFRPMAVIGAGDEVYYVFGAVQDNEEENQRQLRLILARREETEGGASHYVICEKDKDVEKIISSYLQQIIAQKAGKPPKQSPKLVHMKSKKPMACRRKHRPLEVCCCNQPEYLQ